MLKFYCGFGDIFGKKGPKTGEMLKMSKFAGSIGLFGPIDPENSDNFDIFNISLILGPFWGMLKFYCGLGDPFAIRSPKPQWNLNFPPPPKKKGMINVQRLTPVLVLSLSLSFPPFLFHSFFFSFSLSLSLSGTAFQKPSLSLSLSSLSPLSLFSLSLSLSPSSLSLLSLSLGRTPRGSYNRTLLRSVLRRFSTSRCFLEGFLEGAW